MIAATLWQLGEVSWAQANFEELEDFTYWENLCRLQADAAKYEDALMACEKAIELEPKDAPIWAAHSGILLNLEQYPEAIASAERSLNFDDQNSLALTYQCIAYTALDQTETALDVCNDALRLDGDWGNRSPALAWRYRGTILEQAEQYPQALVAYERTLLLEPDDSLTLAYKCRTQINLGRNYSALKSDQLALENYQSALESCRQALNGNGNWGPETAALALYHQGIAHNYLDQYTEAIAAYDLALEVDPNNGEIWTYQGQVFHNQEQYTEALTSYTRAVELLPMSSRALVGQCSAMNQLQQHAEAAAACEQAIQGDGEWWEVGAAQAWSQRGVALAGQAMYEPALAAANRAVGMRPDYAQAWSDRSVILWYLGRLEEVALNWDMAQTQYDNAINSVTRAIGLNAEAPRSHANLGRYYRSMAQLSLEENDVVQANTFLQQAFTSYQEALRLDPEDAETWVNQSTVLWLFGEYEQALIAAQEAIYWDRNSAVAWQTQGAALSSLADYKSARSSYEQALIRDETNADIWASLGVMQLKLSDIDAGLASLQKALELNPNHTLAQQTLILVEQQLQAADSATSIE
ncbi:MAG: tetratricopeptide repeat protein [Cyanobacteria bacterium J06642_11]